MITQDQLKDISIRIEKLKSYLQIEKKLIEISNEEEKTANPEFWNNPKEAEKIMKELRFKKKWVEDYNKVIALNDDLSVFHVQIKRAMVIKKSIVRFRISLSIYSYEHTKYFAKHNFSTTISMIKPLRFLCCSVYIYQCLVLRV